MAQSTADVQFLIEEIRKSRPLMIGMGVVMILGAVGGSFIPVEAGAAAWVPFVKWIFMVLIAATGVAVLILGVRPAEKHAAVVLLTQTPDRIVWGHVMQVRTNGVHSATLLVLHTDDKKTIQAPLPRTEAGEERGLALLRAVAPRASIGFRPEYEAMFKEDPASLRKT